MAMFGIGKVATSLLLLLSWFPFLGCAQNVSTNGITHRNEVTALKDVKKALFDVNNNLSNWAKGDPCTANWTGVLCFNLPKSDGYLHVKELRLLNLNLSGTLSPSLGKFLYLEILNFMWNEIGGIIPKEIGNITSLKLLLLNGNRLSGSLPEELGFLPHLDRIQIDQNNISGPLPTSFANLNNTRHFHMNNNSISGQIPPELSRLPNLVHFLLDNNDLTGYVPSTFSQLPKIRIIQLDNNNFGGTTIPQSFGNISTLLKLSLRNCHLEGSIPDFGGTPKLYYLDLSKNNFRGPIPTNKLPTNMTTLDLSDNNLKGAIPATLSELPHIQKLSLANNSLTGSISSDIWKDRTLNPSEQLLLDFSNNMLSSVAGSIHLPQNVTLWLKGNPACSNTSFAIFCGANNTNVFVQSFRTNSSSTCSTNCPQPYEYSPKSPIPCFCAAPLIIDYRLKSPGFSDFVPYKEMFEAYFTDALKLNLYQLDLKYFYWEEGPRLMMNLKIFPVYNHSDTNPSIFNASEVQRVLNMVTGWNLPDSDIFGPYELIDILLLQPYAIFSGLRSRSSGIGKGTAAGIVLGAVAAAVILSSAISLLIFKSILRNQQNKSKRRRSTKASIKIDGVKDFTFAELASATNNFDSAAQVGQGGYGRVYKGIMANGATVAIKRAEEGSLQGEKEFLTEIELLSRLHHRNLLSLVGYCDEEDEQMLVYEFMENGTLRDHISVRNKNPPSFNSRMKIALASAKGILYLHSEADPPIFHRDIKASNILLDSNFIAKVADFGLSRIAPVLDDQDNTPGHVSTVVKGTPGYLDPEYFLTHKLTDKSDVYSLGVVFLELLTGRQPISHGKNIVREVAAATESGIVFSVLDDRMASYPPECAEKFLQLALGCCADDTDRRPSMAEVVRELENIMHMMSESDQHLDSMATASDQEVSFPRTTSAVNNPFTSFDVSGSNLMSGDIPAVTPR